MLRKNQEAVGLKHTEHLCSIVSSTGIALSCDQPPKYKNNDVIHGWKADNLYGDTVFVHGNEVARFSKLLNRFSNPMVIVVNGDDKIMPYDYSDETIQRLLNSDKVLAVYLQNNCLKFKFRSIPIGIDYHTLFRSVSDHPWGNKGMTAEDQERELIELRNNILPISNCDAIPVLANFHLAMNTPKRRASIRIPIYESLREVKWIKWLSLSSRCNFWLSMKSSAFVICPAGEGYDTHRVWEVLSLGRIPVIQKLPINGIYDGLPVWEVDDWNAFSKLDSNDLSIKMLSYVDAWSNFKWEKLDLSFWVSEISSHKKK